MNKLLTIPLILSSIILLSSCSDEHKSQSNSKPNVTNTVVSSDTTEALGILNLTMSDIQDVVHLPCRIVKSYAMEDTIGKQYGVDILSTINDTYMKSVGPDDSKTKETTAALKVINNGAIEKDVNIFVSEYCNK